MVIEARDVRDELAFDETALGIDADAFDELLEGAADDENDDGLIGRETERVEKIIDVSLGTETVEKMLSRASHVDDWDLPLPYRPVQAVESIDIDTDRVSGSSVSTEDVIVHETHLELAPGADRRSWPTQRRAVTVEWTHGCPDDEIPEPIRGAIIGLVRTALQEIEADGIESESIAGDSVTYELRDDVVARHLTRAATFEAPSYYGGTAVI